MSIHAKGAGFRQESYRIQSSVESHSGAPLPEEPEAGAKAADTEGAYGLDGTLLDDGGVSARLDRKLQRQSALYGREAGSRYLAKLLELDAGQDDFFDRADDALGLVPGSICRLIEGLKE